MTAEHKERKAKRSNELGPVGQRLARNVAEIRGKSPTTYELARRLERLGRPILPSSITRIEAKQRRVDADDLVALALALDVSPNRLLLPGSANDTDSVQLAERFTTTERMAWRWANLPDLEPDPPLETVGPHWGELQSIWGQVKDLAKRIDCSTDVLLRLIRKSGQ